MQAIHPAKTAILQPNDGKPAYAYREKERKLMSAVSWCRANAMLLIALLAAGITVAFVPPDKGYLGYYDARTLACLFCVLAVVCALRNMDLFSALSQQLVQLFHTTSHWLAPCC